MKEPAQPRPPVKYSEKYSRKFDRIELLTKHFMHEDRIDDYIADRSDEEEPLPNIEKFHYDNTLCTLGDLLAKLPDDVAPEDVVLSLHRDRYMDHFEFKVQYKKCVNQEELDTLFAQDSETYQTELAKYQKELAQYREWATQQEIAKKEQELAELRKKLTNH